jgi:hypothetical protein
MTHDPTLPRGDSPVLLHNEDRYAVATLSTDPYANEPDGVRTASRVTGTGLSSNSKRPWGDAFEDSPGAAAASPPSASPPSAVVGDQGAPQVNRALFSGVIAGSSAHASDTAVAAEVAAHDSEVPDADGEETEEYEEAAEEEEQQVGRCSNLTVSNPWLKVPMVSALEFTK